MSYCRWSSDDFKCDIYAYADIAGGYTIHVATNRHKEGSMKNLPSWGPEVPKEEAEARLAKWCEEALVPLDLPHAGGVFREPSLISFLNRLYWLRALGYLVPDKVFDRIKEELTQLPKLV